MTNFEPLKDKMWEAAQKSDKTTFDDYSLGEGFALCARLVREEMEKNK